MSGVVVVARAKAQPGQADAMERALCENAEESRREPTCISYTVLRSEGGVFVTIERWESKEAVDAHMETPHVKRLFEAVAPLLDSRPEIDIFHEV
jgi:quinol monooxygenase YgiN